jgi:hypothetical protein
MIKVIFHYVTSYNSNYYRMLYILLLLRNMVSFIKAARSDNTTNYYNSMRDGWGRWAAVLPRPPIIDWLVVSVML